MITRKIPFTQRIGLCDDTEKLYAIEDKIVAHVKDAARQLEKLSNSGKIREIGGDHWDYVASELMSVLENIEGGIPAAVGYLRTKGIEFTPEQLAHLNVKA